MQGFGGTVWTEFTPLANKHQAINLGQGFPDFPAPQFVVSAARDAIMSNLNQYTRSQGHLRLVNALAKYYSPLFGRQIDPLSEIVVTIGMYLLSSIWDTLVRSNGRYLAIFSHQLKCLALFSTIQALINPGDEVILFEPFYDSYPSDISTIDWRLV
jgi:kynurenine--oxoglutarate transaminase/cysteine-S-conjugate beta-lyase/glutamine--phenylpyruvate transaminase